MPISHSLQREKQRTSLRFITFNC